MSTKKKADPKRKGQKPGSAPVQGKKEEKGTKVEATQVMATAAPVLKLPVNPARAEGVEDSMDGPQVMAAMQVSKERIATLQAELEDERQWAVRLYRRFQAQQDGFLSAAGLAEAEQPQDGRKVFNPEKNLKISAIRAYGWAKRAKKSADQARQSVLDSTLKSAKSRYGMTKLPESVEKYIEDTYRNYANIKVDMEAGANA